MVWPLMASNILSTHLTQTHRKFTFIQNGDRFKFKQNFKMEQMRSGLAMRLASTLL